MLKTRGQDTALLLRRLAALGMRALTHPSLAPKQVRSFLAISRHQRAPLFNSCIYLEKRGKGVALHPLPARWTSPKHPNWPARDFKLTSPSFYTQAGRHQRLLPGAAPGLTRPTPSVVLPPLIVSMAIINQSHVLNTVFKKIQQKRL